MLGEGRCHPRQSTQRHGDTLLKILESLSLAPRFGELSYEV